MKGVNIQLLAESVDVNTLRIEAAKNLKKQADRMVSRSTARMKPIEVGDNVLVPIPEFDRGRGDPANLVGVVLTKDDGMFKVGTKAGVGVNESNSVLWGCDMAICVSDDDSAGLAVWDDDEFQGLTLFLGLADGGHGHPVGDDDGVNLTIWDDDKFLESNSVFQRGGYGHSCRGGCRCGSNYLGGRRVSEYTIFGTVITWPS